MPKPESTDLPDNIDALKALVLSLREDKKSLQEEKDSLQEEKNSLQELAESLKELVLLFRSRQFGKSSEKAPGQAELFDEVEIEADPAAPDEAIIDDIGDEESGTEAPSKNKPGRKRNPSHLPRVPVNHDLPEAAKVCECGCSLECIGEETSEQLDIIPAILQVLAHARKKYICPSCDKAPVIADKPADPIPRSNASPGLLAHIAVAKYQDGLPLYRMENIFERLGVHLPRNTQANWMIKCAELLQPLYNLMNDQLLDSGYIHMDETRVQVLKEPDKPPDSQSYMWVRKTGDADKPIILFDYAPTRGASVVKSLLGDYQGYLQTDDYAGYHAFGKQQAVTHIGCWTHARRKFVNAQKAAPSKKGKISKADMAVQMIQKLYTLETRIKDLSPEERYQQRQHHAVPQLEKIRQWLDKTLLQTLPKGETGKALAYLNKNWDKLTIYTSDGRLNIDNNPVENAIRPFAIGRKNWIFSDSQAGAKTSAMMYSIIETAKANEIEPYAYLRTLFTRLPLAESLEDIEKLLPWNIVLEPLPKS